MHRFVRILIVAAMLVYATVGTSIPASAHAHRRVGSFQTTVGWLEEPAFAGFRNAVQLILAEAGGEEGHESGSEEEHAGTPVTGAALKVEVIFGDRRGTEKTEPLEMRPAFGTPGEYRAFLIPTRPGTYTFHITGRAGKKKLDEYYTSGEVGKESDGSTYNDVRHPSDVQFPGEAPTNVELSEKLDASSARLAAAASSADDAAGTATVLAIVGIAAGLLGAALGLVGVRRARGVSAVRGNGAA